MAKHAGGHSVYRNRQSGDFKIFPGDGVVPGWDQVGWSAGTRRDAEPMLRAYQNPCHECGQPVQYPQDHGNGCSLSPFIGKVIG